MQESVVENSLTCKIQGTALEINLQTNTQTLRRRWQMPLFKDEEQQ